MTALAADRNTPRRDGDRYNYPVAASTTLYAGGIGVLDASGNLEPGATATGKVAVGRIEQYVDNSGGSAGDLNGDVRPGVYRFANSASADEITAAEIGDTCYIVDDQTVAKTDGTGSRSAAGTVVQVDSLGVWVKIGL